MVMRLGVLLGAVMLLVCLPAMAVADWYDDFDSYAAGTRLDNVNGWFGWDNNPASAGVVTDAISHTAPNSVEIGQQTGVDTVHPFSGYDSGFWVFTAYQYLPDNLDSMSFFIINNEYQHGGPHDWALEVHMEPGVGVYEAVRDPGAAVTLPILYDQWVELRCEIDLDNNWMDFYYGGDLLNSGIWNIRTGGLIEIQNVDLYGLHNVSVFFDTLSLVPEPTACVLLALLAGVALRRR
jgi:hypothetical protein